MENTGKVIEVTIHVNMLIMYDHFHCLAGMVKVHHSHVT